MIKGKQTDQSETVWILRDDYRGKNNIISPIRNETKITNFPKSSCLKKSGGKNKSNQGKAITRQARKCVHYAPFLSQEICAYTKKSNPKKSSNHLKSATKNFGTSLENPWKKQNQYDQISTSSDSSSYDSSDFSLSSLSSLTTSSESSLNSTFTESLSPPSPSLSLISSTNTNDSFRPINSCENKSQKNVRFSYPQQNKSETEDYASINEQEYTYLNIDNPTLPTTKINQIKKPKMKKFRSKTDKTVKTLSSIISEPSEKSTKKRSKRVDFSDFKFGKSSEKKAANNTPKVCMYENNDISMLTATPHLDIRTTNSSNSSQSSPKSSELANTSTCEDSSFSSNISTSSDHSSGIDKPLQSNSKTVSSISSTSSGVSSHISSSASSTTSETPFTDSSAKEKLVNFFTPALQSNVSNVKLAPKAVISDDGDIGVENNQRVQNSFYRDSQINNRSSMRMPSSSISMIQRHASERLSCRLSNQNQYNNQQQNNYQQNYQKPQSYQQTKQQNNYQPINKNHQNQLAAAAAAAAAMDKSKQRDALVEYMKIQQQKIRSTEPYQPNDNYSQYNRATVQSHSTILPRKQINHSQEHNNRTNKPTKPEIRDYHTNQSERPYSTVVDSSSNSILRAMSFRCASASNAKSINRKSTPVSSKHVINNNFVDLNSYSNYQHVNKTSAKRDNGMGLCYLMFGPETKRTLLPSQVTAIDTVKALFVRAFPEKLTMNFLDNDKLIKIYIKDQQKELFYELDEMSDVKDRCVLKLVDLSHNQQNQPLEPQIESSPMNQKNELNYYQISQSNFIEDDKLLNSNSQMFNEYYSTPVTKIQTPTSYRYNPIVQQQKVFVEKYNSPSINCKVSQAAPPTVHIQNNNNNRSASEPRHNYNAYTKINSNFIKKLNEDLDSDLHMPETYDNINEHKNQSNHQSRSEAKYSNIYGTTSIVRPSYVRMQSEQPTLNRDIKSEDRDVILYTQSPDQRKLNSQKNNSSIMMGLNAKLSQKNAECIYSDLRNSPSNRMTLDDLCARSRSESITPRQEELSGESTEDDLTSNSNMSYNSCVNKKCCTVKADNKDSPIEDYEGSKAKMKLMQQQLETLTNLVHKALANKDLNQLEKTFTGLNEQQTKAEKKMVKSIMATRQPDQQNLAELNLKTKMLRQDLMTIRNLHENLNISFGDSMKSFINQLNDKLKSFCRNEINEKIKLDLIVYKYQLDSSKIETELNDLENVVDDLRQNILKRKCNISIDDVECYALALSQLSKQLVSLKSSFSTIREHLKNSYSNKNKNSENTFLIRETANLDMIIRRCKRITGILIILKKMAIAAPRLVAETNSLNRNHISKQRRLPQSIDALNVNEKPERQSLNNMKSLLEEIQGIQPDHAHRKLVVEVDDAFSQLMNEISTVANEINTSLTRKSESLSRESSRSPTRSIKGFDECKISRLVYPRVTNPQHISTNLNKVELMYRNGRNNETSEEASCKKLSQIPLFIKETSEFTMKDNNADDLIKKRNKFRQQKESLKELKENNLTYQNDSLIDYTNNQSYSSSNSPPSSFTSSPSRTPTPSSPLSSSGSPVSGINCNQNNTTNSEKQYTPICNSLNQAALAIQQPIITSNMLKTIDRSFHLETVQEEDITLSNDNAEDDHSNASTLMSSQREELLKKQSPPKESNQNTSSLYEQLSHLKPLNKSSALPVNDENNTITSSMIITPSFSEFLNTAADNDKQDYTKKSMIPTSVSHHSKVRFSDSGCNWDIDSQVNQEIRTISSSSSTSSCGSSSGYNSDNNGNKNVQKHSGLKKSGDFFNDLIKNGNTQAMSSMVMPRRIITSPSLGSSSSPHKRVSLSVTDL